MKPKLFFVINSLEGGGAERVVSILSNYFCYRQFDVTVVCFNRKYQAYPLSKGVKLHYLVNRSNKTGIAHRLRFAFLTFFRLVNLLARERPSCVVSFMTTVNLWTGLICNLLRIPYIVSERITPDYTVNKYTYLLKAVSFLIYSKSKAIVIPAKGMIDCFRKNKAYKRVNKFRVIHNPVAKIKEEQSSAVYKRKFILAAGRLDPQKGFDILIEAFAKLKADNIDLLIIGEGYERERLTAQIDRLQLADQVKLIGFKSNLTDYYQQAELFVLSSRNEGYPNVLIEAMSYGAPCVAMDCEFGPAEIITHGWNGLLVENNRVDKLAEAIAEILRNPVLRANISNNARLINETNSLDTITEKWEQLILSDD